MPGHTTEMFGGSDTGNAGVMIPTITRIDFCLDINTLRG